jgi:drug/metabolite transporter (DMT)-like permease
LGSNNGFVFAALAGMMFSFWPILAALISPYTNVAFANVLIFGLATAFYMVILARNAGRFGEALRNWRRIFATGFFSFLANLLFYYSVWCNGAVTTGFVMRFMLVFSAILGALLLRERLGRIGVFGILTAVAGGLAISSGDLYGVNLTILLPFGAALCFAVGDFLSKIFVRKIDPVSVAFGNTTTAFFLFFAYALFTGQLSLAVAPEAVGYAVLIAAMGPIFGFMFLLKALKNWEFTKVMAVRTIEPVFTSILAFAVFAQTPTVVQFFGGTLIVAGILMLVGEKYSQK